MLSSWAGSRKERLYPNGDDQLAALAGVIVVGAHLANDPHPIARSAVQLFQLCAGENEVEQILSAGETETAERKGKVVLSACAVGVDGFLDDLARQGGVVVLLFSDHGSPSTFEISCFINMWDTSHLERKQDG